MSTARPTRPNIPPRRFQSVAEANSPFLALFPHRYDYLWAEHPDPGERPEWRTESRYPLSDRHLQQGTYLYGVRFGKLTRYLMLDIDRHSPYHPVRDPFAINRIIGALEGVGLVAYVAVTSSYSGGIHLYLPFTPELESWAIALVASTLLSNAGFKLKPGQLEVFPNPRPYTNGTPSLYNGHRVPMQAGSYLLNQKWEPIYSDQAAFVRQWCWAERRNDLDHKALERILRRVKQQQFKVSGDAQKFLNDLNIEIDLGWTGYGQTNRLLGRIAMREYVFGHILRGGEPLTGQALADAIVEVASSLPGYAEYCRHRHEIQKLALDWARNIEASSTYYPYTPSKRLQAASQPANNIVSFNQHNHQTALDAERRIRSAIATLQVANNYPSTPSARADAIIALARCSKQTLHRHKPLWHPDYLERGVQTGAEPITRESDDLTASALETLELPPGGDVHPINHNKFGAHPAALHGPAGGQLSSGGSGGNSTDQAGDPPADEGVQQVLLSAAAPGPDVKAEISSSVLEVAEAISHQNLQRQQERRGSFIARMQLWLSSGDPILVAEAEQYIAAKSNLSGQKFSDGYP